MSLTYSRETGSACLQAPPPLRNLHCGPLGGLRPPNPPGKVARPWVPGRSPLSCLQTHLSFFHFTHMPNGGPKVTKSLHLLDVSYPPTHQAKCIKRYNRELWRSSGGPGLFNGSEGHPDLWPNDLRQGKTQEQIVYYRCRRTVPDGRSGPPALGRRSTRTATAPQKRCRRIALKEGSSKAPGPV